MAKTHQNQFQSQKSDIYGERPNLSRRLLMSSIVSPLHADDASEPSKNCRWARASMDGSCSSGCAALARLLTAVREYTPPISPPQPLRMPERPLYGLQRVTQHNITFLHQSCCTVCRPRFSLPELEVHRKRLAGRRRLFRGWKLTLEISASVAVTVEDVIAEDEATGVVHLETQYMYMSN